eukprot:521526_1
MGSLCAISSESTTQTQTQSKYGSVLVDEHKPTENTHTKIEKKEMKEDETEQKEMEQNSLIAKTGDGSCELELNDCKHFKNIIFYLDYHLKTSQNTTSSRRRMIDEMYDINEHYTVNDLMIDYIHIQTCHNNIKIPENILKCDQMQNCSSKRRYRNREMYTDSNNEFKDDIHEINLQQSIDTIHCNLLHDKMVSNTSKFVTDVTNITINDQKEQTTTVQDSKQVDDPFMKYRQLPVYQFGSTPSHFNIRLWAEHTKYTSLKEEYLSNALHSIENLAFNCLYQKAINWMNIYKSNLPHVLRESPPSPTNTIIYNKGNLKKGTNISIEHIMTIMSYCNMDTLQRKYKKGFMSQFKNENVADRLSRLSEIGNWAKFMYESVFFFGSVFKHTNDSVFHGLNIKLKFSMMGTSFRLPTSTTTQFVVAQNFAQANGITLELFRTTPIDWNNLYFDVHSKYVLTDYPNEYERIIFDTLLGFGNIIYMDINNEFDHKGITTALYLYQQMIYAKHYAHRKQICKKKVQNKLMRLMRGLMGINTSKVDHYLLYLFECMNINGAWSADKLFLIADEFKQLKDELQILFIQQFVPFCVHKFNVSLKWVDSISMHVTKDMLNSIRSTEFIQSGGGLFSEKNVNYEMKNGEIMTVGLVIYSRQSTDDIDAAFMKLNFPDGYESVQFWVQLWIPQTHYNKVAVGTFKSSVSDVGIQFVPACVGNDIEKLDSFDIVVSFRCLKQVLKQ